jgi:hypothetical protein
MNTENKEDNVENLKMDVENLKMDVENLKMDVENIKMETEIVETEFVENIKMDMEKIKQFTLLCYICVKYDFSLETAKTMLKEYKYTPEEYETHLRILINVMNGIKNPN